MERLTDAVFNKTDTLEELVTLMNTGVNGEIIDRTGDYIAFKSRFDSFKDILKKDLPELTFDEVLKFDSLINKFRDVVYSWNNVHDLLVALEFEQRKNKINLAVS